jgi:hypothetical protein
MRRVGLIVLAAFAAACESQPVEIHDEGVFQPAGRVLYRPGATPGDETWFGLELDLAHAQGDDEQGVVAGENVVFDGEVFVGPTELDIDYELTQATLAGVLGREFGQHGSARCLLGVGWQQRDLELVSGAQRAQDEKTWAGLLVGLDAQWYALRGLGLGARATATADSDATMQVLELGLLLAPRQPLGLFAGWRWFEYAEEDLSGSDIDLHASGPTISLRGSL